VHFPKIDPCIPLALPPGISWVCQHPQPGFATCVWPLLPSAVRRQNSRFASLPGSLKWLGNTKSAARILASWHLPRHAFLLKQLSLISSGMFSRHLPKLSLLPLALFLALSFLPPGISRGAVVLGIGQNFTAATYGPDSGATPPDAGIAVSSNHVVHFINGRFSVFSKTNSSALQTMSDLTFWGNAGVSFPSGFVSDPRVFYDNPSHRWLAAMVDVPSSGPNRFLLAASATADPTGTWRGAAWTADPTNSYFADFPTLGFDSQGVYLGGDMFSGNTAVGSLLVSIPKSDVLANPINVNNRTSFGVKDYSIYGRILQPAITVGNASTPEAVLAVGDLGYDFQPHSTIVGTTIANAAGPGAPTLAGPTSRTVPPYSIPINPPQPGGNDNLDDGDARLSAAVYRIGDILYAVHAVEVNARAALQWFKVSATNFNVIQTGVISDPDLNLFFPSIAANSAGMIVIACNGCSTNTFISCYAALGEPLNGSVSFGNLVLLKAGQSGYRTNSSNVSRWGDYSAISVDPSDPNRFWSLTMYPSSTTAWSTEITELIVSPLRLSITRSGPNVIVSWPASAAGYQLYSTSSLSPASWTLVAQSPTPSGDQLTVTLPASSAAQFFRLLK